MSVFSMQEYSAGDDLKKIKAHLFMLNEQLRYMFANMTPDENFSPVALAQYKANEQQIQNNQKMIWDAKGNISILERTAPPRCRMHRGTSRRCSRRQRR